jgi:hypothetical protein
VKNVIGNVDFKIMHYPKHLLEQAVTLHMLCH